jgi:hypothetical protein
MIYSGHWASIIYTTLQNCLVVAFGLGKYCIGRSKHIHIFGVEIS